MMYDQSIASTWRPPGGSGSGRSTRIIVLTIVWSSVRPSPSSTREISMLPSKLRRASRRLIARGDGSSKSGAVWISTASAFGS